MLIIYTGEGCFQCKHAIRYAERKNLSYTTRSAEDYRDDLRAMGFTSLPVIVTEDGDAFAGFRPDRMDAAAKGVQS